MEWSHTGFALLCPSHFCPVVFQLWPAGILGKHGEKWDPIKVSLEAESVCQVVSNIWERSTGGCGGVCGGWASVLALGIQISLALSGTFLSAPDINACIHAPPHTKEDIIHAHTVTVRADGLPPGTNTHTHTLYTHPGINDILIVTKSGCSCTLPCSLT